GPGLTEVAGARWRSAEEQHLADIRIESHRRPESSGGSRRGRLVRPVERRPRRAVDIGEAIAEEEQLAGTRVVSHSGRNLRGRAVDRRLLDPITAGPDPGVVLIAAGTGAAVANA